MEWNIKTTGLIIAIFFIGYFIGLIEAAIKQKNIEKKKIILEDTESVELPPAEDKHPNLFSINRNNTNDLEIELEGQTFTNKDALPPDKKNLLVNLLVEIRPWLEIKTTPPIPKEIKTQQEPLNIKSETASTAIPAIPKVSQKSKPVPASESIVSQIDTVLQDRLAKSSMANQGIRLIESSTGGVLVYVGLNKFDGIDAVPNPEIKEIIRQAVAEWEGRS